MTHDAAGVPTFARFSQDPKSIQRSEFGPRARQIWPRSTTHDRFLCIFRERKFCNVNVPNVCLARCGRGVHGPRAVNRFFLISSAFVIGEPSCCPVPLVDWKIILHSRIWMIRLVFSWTGTPPASGLPWEIRRADELLRESGRRTTTRSRPSASLGHRPVPSRVASCIDERQKSHATTCDKP